MKTRELGTSGLTVSAIGMGCMGFSHGYGALPPESEALRLMALAHELGCTFYDTAEVYGPFVNEELTGKGVAPFRKDIVLATKFSPFALPGQDWPYAKLSAQGIRRSLEESLKRLGTDYVDLYYLHRVPEDCDLEAIADTLGALIREGLVRGWGLSQATEAQVRRAHAVTPLAAIQSEYSMMERMFEKDVIPACAALGIGFVPFSPLASGFLSGKYTQKTEYSGDDVRRVITRFSKENVAANQPLLDLLDRFAREKHATPAQVSLAWILHKGDFIVPIPGMRKEERVRENLAAADITLTDAEFAALEKALAGITIHGNRTDKDIEKLGTVRAS
ncbi:MULTISPECIES: aldo/keto reductase [unclassified Desulfovibrio]|uniref:aldo/keto reductase n=1 Tax=unclassified Desulfovibrio TaxID=2593640 RepID=UPI0013ED246F|nr:MULTISPECIES: aldo/keto reductase [unclassified Desulfovibrio]